MYIHLNGEERKNSLYDVNSIRKVQSFFVD